MKAQRRFGLSLSWARVTVVFLVVIAILLIASHCPDSWQGNYRIAWWVGVGISAIIALLSLVTHHGLTVTTSADSDATRSGYASTTAAWSP
jgi:hypothetical protein